MDRLTGNSNIAEHNASAGLWKLVMGGNLYLSFNRLGNLSQRICTAPWLESGRRGRVSRNIYGILERKMRNYPNL